MRALFVLISFVGVGCGVELRDPCAGISGTCIALQVKGAHSLGKLDAFAVTVQGPLGGTKTFGPEGNKTYELPVAIGIELTQIIAKDTSLTIDVVGSRSGTGVGYGHLTATVAPQQHVKLDVVLDANSIDDMNAIDLSFIDATVIGDASGDANDDLTGVSDDLTSGPDLEPACTIAAECSDALPICDAVDRVCRACSGVGDDAVCGSRTSATVCITSGSNLGRCGVCNPADTAVVVKQDDRCTVATAPVCNAAGACEACTAHAQCKSQVCNLSTGACYAVSDIAYVDNSSDGCFDALHDSAPPGFPYCQVNGAVTVSTKNVLHVGGSVTPYSSALFKDLAAPLLIVGPGSTASLTARVGTAAGDEIGIVGDADAAMDQTVTIDGLELGGTAGAKAKNGLFCLNTSSHMVTLTIKDSLFDYATHDGIFTTNCIVAITDSTIQSIDTYGLDIDAGSVTVSNTTISQSTSGGLHAIDGATLTVDRTTIVANPGNGVNLAIANYSIANSLIAKNGLAGLVFDNTSPASGSKIWFSTIVRNGSNGTESGVACGSLSSGTRLIENSIIALNGSSSTLTQFKGDCAFSNVVAGAAENSTHSGMIKLTPAFVDSNAASAPETLRAGFKLTATDTVAKDHLVTQTGFPAVDLYGSPRPQNGNFDIGAHEVGP